MKVKNLASNVFNFVKDNKWAIIGGGLVGGGIYCLMRDSFYTGVESGAGYATKFCLNSLTNHECKEAFDMLQDDIKNLPVID